ncbi:MAG: hypothetical protein ACI4O7_14290 [Aristaeellaceae bacterium]
MALPDGFDPARALLPGLPPFADGRMSDTLYHAGYGLRYLDGRGMELRRRFRGNALAMLQRLQRFVLSGYEVTGRPDRPSVAITDGRLKIDAWQEDTWLHSRVVRVDGLAQDPPCWVRTVTDTTPDAFDRYLALLEDSGYAPEWARTLDGCSFVSLTGHGRRLWGAMYPAQGLCRWADDPVSDPLTAFRTPGGEQAFLVCQYGLHNHLMRDGITSDCGMLYFLRLKDGSLFVIDGGEMEQATDAAVADALCLMRRLTGTAEGRRIPIAAWFCTHAHEDHTDFFGKLLRFHHGEMDVQRVILNFPDMARYTYPVALHQTIDRLIRFFPGVRFLKAHTGQQFSLGGVTFDVLQTHEDGTGPQGEEQLGDFNDTSTVLKASADGVSFLCTGDISWRAEGPLLSRFRPETLRCGCVQSPHHMINQLDHLYGVVAPEYVLVPQSRIAAEDNNVRYRTLRALLPEERLLFTSAGTHILAASHGRWQLQEILPSPQEPFDGSFL